MAAEPDETLAYELVMVHRQREQSLPSEAVHPGESDQEDPRWQVRPLEGPAALGLSGRGGREEVPQGVRLRRQVERRLRRCHTEARRRAHGERI